MCCHVSEFGSNDCTSRFVKRLVTVYTERNSPAAEWKEKSELISNKYGLREKAASSRDRKAILVAPGDGAVNSSSGRMMISAKETLGAFTIVEFTLKPQSVRDPLNAMKEDAAWYVINGELSFEIGDQKVVAPEGG